MVDRSNFRTAVPTAISANNAGNLDAATVGGNPGVTGQAEIGACDNYSFAKRLDSSLHVPTPRVESTNPRYKLFIAPTDVDELQSFFSQEREIAEYFLH